MTDTYREIIKRTEHLVSRTVRVSPRDVQALYPTNSGSPRKLTFHGMNLRHDPVESEFIPTHRIVASFNDKVVKIEYVREYDHLDEINLRLPADIEHLVPGISIMDFQPLNRIGLSPVNFPTALCDPETQQWWLYRVPSFNLTKATYHANKIVYVKDCDTRLNLHLSNQTPTGYVYFVQEDRSGGAVKIGYSRDSDQRLSSHQTSNSSTLKILCDVPGTFEDETLLHHQFAEHRTGGGKEWFQAEQVVQWLTSNLFLNADRTS